MTWVEIVLLCWLGAGFFLTVGYMLGRSIKQTNTPELPPKIPLRGPEDKPFIEVTWGDGTVTRHYIQKNG